MGSNKGKIFVNNSGGVYTEAEVDNLLNGIINNEGLPENIRQEAIRRQQEFKISLLRFDKKLSVEILQQSIIDILKLSCIKSLREEQQDLDRTEETAEVTGTVGVVSQGMNFNQRVRFQMRNSEEHEGYLKSNLIPSFNDTAISTYKVGQLLGVEMAQTYLANYGDSTRTYIVSQIVNQNGEIFLTMKDFRSLVEQQEKEKGISYEKQKVEPTDDKIKKAINYAIDAYDRYIALNPGTARSGDREVFVDAYVRMICFDYVTNQTDRGDQNYGVLMDESGRITFAPLIDSDFIIPFPSQPNQEPFSLDRRYNMDDGLRVLQEMYPEKVEQFLSLVLQKKQDIGQILTRTLSQDMLYGAGHYYDRVERNIHKFEEIIKMKQEIQRQPGKSISAITREALEDGIGMESVQQINRTEQMLT